MDKVTNKDILERTVLPSMEDLLIRKNLRWIGHLTSADCETILSGDFNQFKDNFIRTNYIVTRIMLRLSHVILQYWTK